MWVIIAMYLIFPLQLAKSFSLAGWYKYLFALIEQQECIRWRSVVQLKINNHVAHIPGHLLAAMSTVITDTAHMVCGRVCVTLRCPSVCLSHWSTTARCSGGFAAVGPAGRRCGLIDCCVAGAQQQMWAESRCQLNADSLTLWCCCLWSWVNTGSIAPIVAGRCSRRWLCFCPSGDQTMPPTTTKTSLVGRKQTNDRQPMTSSSSLAVGRTFRDTDSVSVFLCLENVLSRTLPPAPSARDVHSKQTVSPKIIVDIIFRSRAVVHTSLHRIACTECKVAAYCYRCSVVCTWK